MPSTRPASGVPVRGVCPNGHTTDTMSEPGRVTWRGKCSDAKCDKQVVARRRPAAEHADGTPAGSDEFRVREVDYRAQPRKSAARQQQPAGDGGQPAAGDDAGTAAPLPGATGEPAATVEPAAAGPGTEPPARRGVRERTAQLVAQRRQREKPERRFETRYPI